MAVLYGMPMVRIDLKGMLTGDLLLTIFLGSSIFLCLVARQGTFCPSGSSSSLPVVHCSRMCCGLLAGVLSFQCHRSACCASPICSGFCICNYAHTRAIPYIYQSKCRGAAIWVRLLYSKYAQMFTMTHSSRWVVSQEPSSLVFVSSNRLHS